MDIFTLFNCGDLVPPEFFWACGVPDAILHQLPRLVSRPHRHYSCFLSFAEEDRAFAEKLRSSLQSNSIRSWLWNEDALWGKALRKSIHEATLQYDRLVVVLSKQALMSEPVLREIRRALQKEDRLRKQEVADCDVLYPIRIDDSIFGWPNELKADIVEKFIGDFTAWQSDDAFQKGVTRLMQGLCKEVLLNREGRAYPLLEFREDEFYWTRADETE